MLNFYRVKQLASVFCLILSLNVYSGTVSLNLSGLEDLGANARYEAWLVVGGSPISTGTFSVNQMGILSQTEFDVSANIAENASVFMLSIEPFPDLNPAPADSKLLAGDINAGMAVVSVGHPAAVGDDFTASTGSFELINPTGSKGSEFENGIWFLSSFPPPNSAGLSLPTLPSGWVYEGWVVDESVSLPISTGTFTDEGGPDSDGAGPAAGLGLALLFPGQDFINPSRDLSMNHTAVISVEPVPDNAPTPFTLKPLIVLIVDSSGSQLMINNALASNPLGQVNILVGGTVPENVQSVPTLSIGSMVLLVLLLIVYVRFKAS